MNAEIIAVGTEILLGETINSDASIIAKGLSELGFNVYYHTVVGDNPDRLKSVIELAKSRADVIITTGGLGPTADDLTKETIAAAFGKKLLMDDESLRTIHGYFEKTGRRMTQNNEKQAMLPEGCTILKNDWGTAPGCAFEAEGKRVIMLPGPPRECTGMFRTYAMPYLMDMTGEIIFSRNVRVFGMGESAVEDKLSSMIKNMQNPTVAPYAKENECFLRVTAKAENAQKAREMTDPVVDEICGILGDVVYGVDVESLESLVVSELTERGLTLSTAESCTGGLLSKRITDIPGSSACFRGGVCAYSNEIKADVLGIDKKLIEEKDAVSPEVASEMASSVRRLFRTDIGIGITGIAGPGGGSDEKPVGLVYIAIDTKSGTEVRRQIWGNARDRVRGMAASNALDMIRRHIKEL